MLFARSHHLRLGCMCADDFMREEVERSSTISSSSHASTPDELPASEKGPSSRSPVDSSFKQGRWGRGSRSEMLYLDSVQTNRVRQSQILVPSNLLGREHSPQLPPLKPRPLKWCFGFCRPKPTAPQEATARLVKDDLTQLPRSAKSIREQGFFTGGLDRTAWGKTSSTDFGLGTALTL